jgi:hypothetical protein
MAFKRFNQTTLPSGRGVNGHLAETPHITVSPSGRISLGPKLKELLELEVGKRVELLQDEDSPADWFLMASESKEGFELKNDPKSNRLTFQNTPLVKTILASAKLPALAAGAKQKAVRFRVAAEPQEIDGEQVHLIITTPM